MNITKPYTCEAEHCGDPITDGEMYVEIHSHTPDGVPEARVVMHLECLDNVRTAAGQPAPTNRLVRLHAKRLRSLIEELLPNSREKSLVLTKLDEADMWLDRAIASTR